MTIIIPRNPVSLFSIIAAGIAIIVLVSFSGPGGTVTVATVTAHPLDGGVEKKNEVVMVMANNNKKAKGKMCSCTDLKNCKKCLGKGTDCAWKLTTTTTTTGNDNDSASSSSPLSSSPLSSSCVDKENCEEEEGSSCVTAESKESAEYVCGLNCGGAANNNVVQKEGGNNNNNNGCDECLASSQQGGIDCSWYVDNNNNNGGGGGSSKCIGKLQCKDKGFETGSCINPPKKKKKKKKKKKTTTTTCASINGNCFKKTSCKQCLNYNKGGANCAWWVSTDGTTTKCIGAEICNNGKMINGGGGGGGGGDSKKKFGNCTVRDAFATKSSNKETCTALKDVDVDVVDDNNNNNNNNGSSCAEDDDETKCQNIANCNDCFDTEGCGWKQCKTLLFGESDGDDDDDESTCGFDSWGCYPRKDSRAATAATATATADFFCPVLPSCGETFPDLVGKTVKEAFLFFIKTYGKGYLCLPIVVEGSFVTEDFRCDRIRLWVDKKTQTTIVAEPRVG